MERILTGIRSSHITYKDDIVNVAVSAGIASATRIIPSAQIEPLMEQARRAVSRAREAGGNQIYLTFI